MQTDSLLEPRLFSELAGGGFRGSVGGRAFAAAVLGWFVFPLPGLGSDALDATADRATNEPADIYDLWGLDLDGGQEVGVAYAASRLTVIECSTQFALDGFLSRHRLSPAPQTVEVRFGLRRHLYFSTYIYRGDIASVSALFDGEAIAFNDIDYVVGAGSRRGGEFYEYGPGHAPDEIRVAALPEDWAEYMKP